jgi:16S rRNA (cytosine967-C5)-methyltransferase
LPLGALCPPGWCWAVPGRRRHAGAGPAGPREVARRALARVESEQAYASLALAAELTSSHLADVDRRLATELVYGVLRHRTRIDRALVAMTSRGKLGVPTTVRAVLRVGAYQILFLDRVPARAAIHEAVDAARAIAGERVGGFVNGLLRRLDRDREPPLPSAGDPDVIEITCSWPRWILDHLVAAIGPAEVEPAARALHAAAPLGVRAHTGRITAEELARRLAGERAGLVAELVPGVGEALRVTGGGDPAASPAFRAGLFTVQDPAAQLVSHLLGATPGQAVLDACAGVGGKTTHLAQLAGPTTRIVAADQSQAKLAALAATAARLGVSGIEPRAVDLTSPGVLGETFDAVLLDAPCSGLGVLRRHPELKWRRAPEGIAPLCALQERLLDAVATSVRPGGTLVYAVCSFVRAEGPEQVAGFLARHPDFRRASPPPAAGVDWARYVDELGQLATWPHRHGMDAFFAVRLVRTAP